MVETFRRKANFAVALYFVFKIAAIGWAISAGKDSPINTSIFWLLFLAGAAFAFRACWAQGRAKGYGPSFALMGLFGFLGLIIVALLRDEAKASNASAETSVTPVA
jgi:cbb3-type cytochrome oxidase subunit 3